MHSGKCSIFFLRQVIFIDFLYFTAELGYIACYHNISHSSMEFMTKYLKQVRTVNSILHIISEAPVFTNFQVGTQVNCFISTHESSSLNPFVIINQIILLHEELLCGLWWLSSYCAFNCYSVKLKVVSKVVFWPNIEFYWTVLCLVKILWVMWKRFFVQQNLKLNINKKIIYINGVLTYHKEFWTDAMESAL